MKKTLVLLTSAIALLFASSISIDVKAQQVKNVIIMIPDGCSLATVSTARWYQRCFNPSQEYLNIDPYISGLIRTTCSNAPIGDSAPTTSCFMTGYNQLAGWVSTYPLPSGDADIYTVDSTRAYQPLTTVFEAARIKYGKSTGLVCTCEFPQATPADCSSHSYNRSRYDWIIPQQVHNGINVVIGGGAGLLPSGSEEYLSSKGYGVFRNDINAMRSFKGDNMWALFANRNMRYDMDRDKSQEPSLEEMTEIAIGKLSRNPKGFILMVEGSQVDFAAHDNDPVGMVTEFLAFDRACKVALDFAKRDGNTAVIIVPDHGNSGISIGRRDQHNYSYLSASQLFGALTKYKMSAPALAEKINNSPYSEVQNIFRENCGFELSEVELEALKQNKEYRQSPIPEAERKPFDKSLYNSGLSRIIAQFLTERTGLAFTTNGHTGEDVFLASYHPQSEHRLMGMHTNVELNEYLCNMLGDTREVLDSLTAANFAPHTEVLKGYKCVVTTGKNEGHDAAKLTVTGKCNKKSITFSAYAGSNVVTIGQGKKTREIELPSVVVYVDKKNTFYLPRNILSLLI